MAATLTAAPQLPAHLPLREDLRTRLGSGLIIDTACKPLSDAERPPPSPPRRRNAPSALSPEMISYLLRYASRDMRTLSMLVVAPDQYTSNKTPGCSPAARTAFTGNTHEPRPL